MIEVVRKYVGTVINFSCPECRSELRANKDDLVEIETKRLFNDYEFMCPICKVTQCISGAGITYSRIYEEIESKQTKSF